MMPELDGYGVLYLLSKQPETQVIPFIFLTAKSERVDMRKGMEMGADDYLTKPFDDIELLNAIESRLLKQKKSQEFYTQGLKKLEEFCHLTNTWQDSALNFGCNFLCSSRMQKTNRISPANRE